jgi:hypothetical protein
MNGAVDLYLPWWEHIVRYAVVGECQWGREGGFIDFTEGSDVPSESDEVIS